MAENTATIPNTRIAQFMRSGVGFGTGGNLKAECQLHCPQPSHNCSLGCLQHEHRQWSSTRQSYQIDQQTPTAEGEPLFRNWLSEEASPDQGCNAYGVREGDCNDRQRDYRVETNNGSEVYERQSARKPDRHPDCSPWHFEVVDLID
jgi:hypothetical protein